MEYILANNEKRDLNLSYQVRR